MKNRLFILIFILLILFTPSVFATSSTINSDIYNAVEENYTLNVEVLGSVFVSTENFIMQDTASISSNLYALANTIKLKSNVTYSNAISKDGSYSIESINSHSIVDGNVFIICDEFVLEPGSEINGDLYIIANKIDIQKSSSIYGNLFAVSSEILLNGRVAKSVYATCDNFDMNYYGSISKDLHLTSKNATLNSVIHRNAYITSNIITTNSDFLLYEDLEANSHEFNFSGEIDGNATINSKKINFFNTQGNSSKVNCLISGNLNYSSKEEIQIVSGIINGETYYSKYVEKIDTANTFSFKSFVLDLITFIVYVLIIVLIFNLLNKKYQNSEHNITIKNVLSSFGIGLLSFLIIFVALILLLIIRVGVTLGFALLFTYLFLLFIAMPIFILDISLLFKDKCNLYLATGLIALVLSLISVIPAVGTIIMFIFMITSIGRIYNKILFKKC